MTVLLVIGVLGLIAGVFFLEAFVVMVVWGAIAGLFEGPTIGYGLAMLVTVGLGVLQVGAGKASRSGV